MFQREDLLFVFFQWRIRSWVAAEGISIRVTGSSSMLDSELKVVQRVQPALDHSCWSFHGANPFEAGVIGPQKEGSKLKVVQPMSHEVNHTRQFALGWRVVDGTFREFLCSV